MKRSAVVFAFAVGFGALMQLGIRAVEWIVPKPETRIVVCLASDLGEIEVCRSAASMIQKPQGGE